MYRVLVTDEIDPEGVALLAAEPKIAVDEVPTLPKEELLNRIADYDAIVGRSATRISSDLLEKGRKLKVVGRAGVGVDNIALDTATSLGVAVINAPAGNTIAVVELFFGAVISLLRHIPRADSSMHAGRWDRSALLGSELKGRTLGIVGLGRIGGEVATRARAFGMSVIAYDPYIAQSRFEALRAQETKSLESLLEQSNVLTLHTPLTDETTGMIGKREIARLPQQAIVVNLARGGIVDEKALIDALSSKHLLGAVVDAYEKEPLAADHPLRAMPNVLLTPHIGASTMEAQRNVAVDVCIAVRDALLSGELSRSINVADVGGQWSEVEPALTLARRSAARRTACGCTLRFRADGGKERAPCVCCARSARGDRGAGTAQSDQCSGGRRESRNRSLDNGNPCAGQSLFCGSQIERGNAGGSNRRDCAARCSTTAHADRRVSRGCPAPRYSPDSYEQRCSGSDRPGRYSAW